MKKEKKNEAHGASGLPNAAPEEKGMKENQDLCEREWEEANELRTQLFGFRQNFQQFCDVQQ